MILMLWITIQFFIFGFNPLSNIYFLFGFIETILGYWLCKKLKIPDKAGTD